jgi:tetratricopeptide (TPR) repeat protein
MKRPTRRPAGKPESVAAGDVAEGREREAREKTAGLLRTAPNRSWWMALVLVIGTIIVYLPVWHAGFIWDDRSFVIDNPLIHRADGLYRFWFTTQPIDFYPVTSTMLWVEWRVWGTNPVGYHVVNVLLHSLSAVVLWRVLNRLNIPGSWLAAALFAVHPVNVESVAWIAERKNTLAMVFYLLSLLSYVRFDFAARSSPPPGGSIGDVGPLTGGLRWRWYWLSLVAFLLALLSKTVVAPMPLVLLGVAWWRRRGVDRRDVVHCLPFFATAVAVGLVSLWFQSHRAIATDIVRTDSFGARLAGAGWAVWFYLYKAVLPFGLSPIYPRWRIDGGAWWSYVPGMLMMVGFLACWRCRRILGRGPLAAFGYFVVMLLPVLGFLDVGFMRASLVSDHWQYFSIIGPLSLAAAVIATWGEFAGTGRFTPAVVSAWALLAVLGGTTWRQSSLYVDPGTYWRAALSENPGSWVVQSNLGSVLFERGRVDDAMAHFQKAVDLEPDNATAHYNLGGVLRRKGQLDGATTQFQKALDLQPNYSMAHYNLGEILRQKGEVDEAIAHFEMALEIRPDYAEAHDSLAFLLLRKGQVDEGLVHLRAALEIRPDNAEEHNNIASVLWQKGQFREAILHYERALEIRPDYAEAHQGLGEILEHEGQAREAVIQYEKALEAQPDFAEARRSLAWVLATSPEASVRNGGRAVSLAEQAQRLSGGGNPSVLATLAASYAEVGRFREAVEMATRALETAAGQRRTAFANRVRAQVASYEKGFPFREPGRERNPP